MGEISINPKHNVHKKYREVIYVNPFLLGGVFDADAQAFIMASTISDPIQKTAINNLVISLKSNGLWVKMKAIYPFVGGTSFTHKWNLKDPRDLDTSFRLKFIGGWNHSARGAKPNGTTGYSDTSLNPFYNLISNNNHISVYNTRMDNVGETSIDVGAGYNTGEMYFWTYREDGSMKSDNSNSSIRISATTTKNGFSLATRTSSNLNKIYKGGSVIATSVLNNTYQNPDANLFIGAGNISGSPQYFSSKEYGFVTIGIGFDDYENTLLYAIVQDFQIKLLRQV